MTQGALCPSDEAAVSIDSRLVGRSAVELAALVRQGQVSAVEVVSAHLAHVDHHDGEVNAFVHVARDRALAEAGELDAARRRGDHLGELAGVPFSVKDILAVRGMPVAAGSRALDGYVAGEDAPSVARLRQAGAICLGKTNTPEFALFPLTWNETNGYTRNPVTTGPDRSPGGSSGGEAAAVAAGMSAFGLGSDFGGSVRWPAHCTGLVSLRPTTGRVPADGQLPGLRTEQGWVQNPTSVQGRLQVVGPMARNVADLQRITRVLAGDAAAPGEQGQPWSDQPLQLSSLRVAWSDGEGTVPVQAEIRDAVATAAHRLSAVVAELSPLRSAALSEAADLFGRLRATDGHEEIRRWGDVTQFGATIRQLLQHPSDANADTVAALWRRRDALREQLLAQMPDVLLLPVASIGAPRLAEREFLVEGQRLGVWQILAACRAISLFGLPAAVVPVGSLPDGRPIGIQIVARPGADELVLAVAAIMEQLCAPHHDLP
jgi:amidase